MATALYNINISSTDGQTPLAHTDKTRALRDLIEMLEACLSGNARGVHTFSCRTAGVAATGTVTCATVATGNTVTINGTALTATQHHARGTITPTVSGIDVDDTVTINGTALTAKQHYAKGTVTFSSADAADNVTIGATTFVGTVGAVTPGDATYSVDTGNDEAAASLAAQIAAHAVASTVVTATAASAVVTLRAVASGTAGNSIVLTSTDGTDVAVSGSGTLSGATAVGSNQFDISGTNAQCCTSLAAAINAASALSGVVTAWASATVVTVRAVTAGTGGNSITFVSSDAQLAVSGAGTLAGGATVANNQFDFGGTDTETATALKTAINASTTALISGQVIATSSGAVVTLTAVTPGTTGNMITLASSGATLTVTGARLTGGSDTTITHTF